MEVDYTLENHICHYCNNATLRLEQPPWRQRHYQSTDRVLQKCHKCNVVFAFCNGILSNFRIARKHNGKLYWFQRVYCKGHLTRMKLRYMPQGTVDMKDFATFICELDHNKITPDNALKKLPTLLVFS